MSSLSSSHPRTSAANVLDQPFFASTIPPHQSYLNNRFTSLYHLTLRDMLFRASMLRMKAVQSLRKLEESAEESIELCEHLA